LYLDCLSASPSYSLHECKQLALIAVDEMIEVAKSLTMETQEWYEEVKTEIENL